MAKTSAQLDHEVAAALQEVPLAKLYAWRPKLEETVVDVKEGRLSRASGKPVLVSKLDNPRGAFMILDGHHRAVEAIQAGRSTIAIKIDEFTPRIERAGGAYESYVTDKVKVVDFLKRR